MKLRFTKLNDKAITPTRGSDQAAGYDLYSCEDVIIYEHLTEIVHTGIAIEIPEGYFGAIYARSGLATKEGLRPANCVGVIDSDYRGEIMVALHRDTRGGMLADMFTDHTIPAGTRIAQLVIQPYASVEFEEVDTLSETERNAGGFGSTGTK
jgi:dUTP pyrophosphatase